MSYFGTVYRKGLEAKKEEREKRRRKDEPTQLTHSVFNTQLLSQARYPNGIPEQLELIGDTGTYEAEEVEIASIAKNNLDMIGIPVKIRIVDNILMRTVVNSGDSTLSLFSAASGTAESDFLASVNYFSEGNSAGRRFGFNRTDIDELVLQGRAELNVEKRIEIYQKLQMMCDGVDLPRGSIFLYRPWNYAVAWKYVKGDLTPVLIQGYATYWIQIDMDPERKIA